MPDASTQDLLESLNLDLKQPLEKVSTWEGPPGAGEPGEAVTTQAPPLPKGLTLSEAPCARKVPERHEGCHGHAEALLLPGLPQDLSPDQMGQPSGHGGLRGASPLFTRSAQVSRALATGQLGPGMWQWTVARTAVPGLTGLAL